MPTEMLRMRAPFAIAQFIPPRRRATVSPPSITIALTSIAPRDRSRRVRPVHVGVVRLRAGHVVAEEVELRKVGDGALERWMRAVDAGVQMTDEHTVTGEALRPKRWNPEALEPPRHFRRLLRR